MYPLQMIYNLLKAILKNQTSKIQNYPFKLHVDHYPNYQV